MDTVTQAALGGAIGLAGFSNTFGRRAIVIGALAGTVPDFDVVMGLAGETAGWLHHRGITHSLIATPFMGLALGWLTWRWHVVRATGTEASIRRSEHSARAKWMWLWVLCLVTHPLLDFFTPYGTQLLAPFSDHRFALDAMAIIDPAYTLPLLLAIVVGLMVGVRSKFSANLAGAALLATTAYLFFALGENEKAVTLAENSLDEQQIEARQVRAYPTLLQPFYRRVVARQADGSAQIGYLSTLNPGAVTWQHHSAAPRDMVQAFMDDPVVEVFTWFSRGDVQWQAVVQNDGTTRLYLTDLRYGVPGQEKGPTGMWGLTAELDARGQIIEPLTRFSARPAPSENMFTDLWAATVGE